jgi:PAS domain S-box-containing protein
MVAEENPIDKYNHIVERSPESITMINLNYVYEIANDSYCRSLGKPRSEIVGATVGDVWGRDRFEATIKKHLDTCFAGENVSYEETFGFGASERFMHVSFYPHREGWSRYPCACVLHRHNADSHPRAPTQGVSIQGSDYRAPQPALAQRDSPE